MFVLSGVEGYVVRLEVNQALGILIFLGMLKIAADIWRNTLLMGNTEALAVLTTAVADAANAIKDLAVKVAAGQDVSTQMTNLATGLEDVVRAAGEPTTQA